MKENYFKSYFKAYGVIPTVLVILIFLAAGFIGYFPNGQLSVTGARIVNGFLLGALCSTAVVCFTNLKSEKVSFLDLLRVSGFIASIILAIMGFVSDRDTKNIGSITFVVLAFVFLSQLVVRFVKANDGEIESSFKYYFGALAGKYNPLFILLCGVLVALLLFFACKYNWASGMFGNLSTKKCVIAGALIAVLMASFLPAIDKNTETSLFDFGMAVVFVALAYFLFLGISTVSAMVYKLIAVAFGISGVGLLARGLSYNKDKGYDDTQHKVRGYFKQVYDTFDVTLAIAIGFVVLAAVALPVALLQGPNTLTEYLGTTNLTYLSTVSIALLVILVILTLVVRKFKSAKIEKIDFLLVAMLFASAFAIPFFVIILGEDNFSLLTDNTILMVTFCILIAVLVYAAIVQFIRIKNYDPLMSVVEKHEEEQATEEEETVIEEPTEEESYIEEETDPLALTEEDEKILEEYGDAEETEEVVEEEATEEVVEEAQPEEQPQETEETSEEETAEDEESEEDDAEDEESEEDQADEAEADEQLDVEKGKESNVIINDFQVIDENGQVKKIKRKFYTRMMFAPYETKEYYNEIKNYLTMYRAKGRGSARCESFRYKGLVAKLALGGKSIKVFLAIDPAFIEANPKYHLKDFSAKKQYAEVPVMIKVRSPRALKYFKELVDYMMAQRGVKPKRGFTPTDYMPSLIPNGEAILSTLNLPQDCLQETVNAKGIPSELPDDLDEYIPMIPGDDLTEEEVEAPVYLDTLCNHFNDGDEITIDVLKSLHIVTKGNVLRIKARGTLDRKLIIYAEYFDSDALKMVMSTNGTAIKIVRNIEE